MVYFLPQAKNNTQLIAQQELKRDDFHHYLVRGESAEYSKTAQRAKRGSSPRRKLKVTEPLLGDRGGSGATLSGMIHVLKPWNIHPLRQSRRSGASTCEFGLFALDFVFRNNNA